MNVDEKQLIITYRLERAEESLQAAQLLSEHCLLIPAMNRIYYAMFYAVQALLIFHNVSFSKHGQVKGYFNKEFIKQGIFPVGFGRLYNKVFEYRQKFDYVDLVSPDESMISDNLREAKNFIEHIRAYLQKI